MGKLNVFEVNFTNPSAVFFAGSIVEGHVIIDLREPMSMRGIKLKFKGEGWLRWSERETAGNKHRVRHGHQPHNNRVTFRNSETYFEQDVLLHGIWSSQGDTKTELPSGRHTFPFQYQLPQGLPSSYEFTAPFCRAYVRYTAKCSIDKPWRFDHTTKRPFTVVSVLDLNQQPNCLQRLQNSKQKTLGCLCCASPPITASFNIDRGGYVPGEAIKLFAEINNGSNRKMSQSYVTLKMKTTLIARGGRRKRFYRVVARVNRPGIAERGDDTWSGEELIIPPLPPSGLMGCNIIDVDYVLQLTVDPSGIGFDLDVLMDLIIGTIPLAQVVQQFPPMPPPSFNESMYPAMPTPAIPNLPPPSYQECITGRMDIKEEDDSDYTFGDMQYAPVYTYYNWGHTPAALPEGKDEEDD